MSRKQKIFVVLLLSSISLGCAVTWSGIGAIAAAYWYLNPKLPTVDVLKEARMQQPLRVYTRDGKLLAEFGEKRRIPVRIDEVPIQIKEAFLAAEDDRFEQHPGVDYHGLIRAAINQVIKGDRSQGGSTITMQVARNFFLTPEKTYIRKLNEIFLALKIERELNKDKILELYLNKIYLGKRAYGIAAAAQAYYGKTLQELNLAQTAMIAGLPKAPSTYNPIANPERALQRRNYVLGRMFELGYIRQETYAQAAAEPITAGAHEVAVEVQAPYLAEMVRAEVVERYGEEAYVSGMKVHTTIDSRLQGAANRAIQQGLLDYTERHGYRGPVKVTILSEGIKRIELVADSDEEESQPQAGEHLSAEADSGVTEVSVAQPEVQMAKPQDPAEIQQMSRHEVDQMLEAGGRFGDLRLAFVLEIFEREPDEKNQEEDSKREEHTTDEIASIYLGDGEYGELNFDSVRWAKGYVSVNEQGSEPKSMRDVLQIGDLVWVRPNAGEIAEAESNAADSDDGTAAMVDSQPGLKTWLLTQLPEVEGALVNLDPQNGAIISLVGGFDYFKSKFNRAVQAKRQPGSGFKPFVYSAALEDGFTAASIINDAPVVFDDPALEGKWRPENYSGKFFGPTRLREGIVKSRNLVSIRLLISLGIAKARRYAKRFGFDDDALPKDLSLALGSGTLSPLRLVSGFGVFANGGFRIEPYFIDSIENDEGEILWYADYGLACLQCFVDKIDAEELERNYIVEWPVISDEEVEDGATSETVNDGKESETPGAGETAELQQSEVVVEGETTEFDTLSSGENNNDSTDTGDQPLPEPKRVLRQAPRIMETRVNYIMNSILRDVVLRGTGRRALALGRNDIGGKTGTSNDEHDAWFNGFNHKYVTSVWVGFDTHQPLGSGEAGSRAALPVWIDYMREALKGVPEKLPEQPEGLVTMRIDAETGLLATSATRETVFEIFREENVPTERSESAVDIIYDENGEETGTTSPGTSVTEELF